MAMKQIKIAKITKNGITIYKMKLSKNQGLSKKVVLKQINKTLQTKDHNFYIFR